MRATILCFAFVASACTAGNDCGPGTYAVGNACLPETTCPEGYLSQNGDCVAIVAGCAPGSSIHNGACVPDITDCGAGTHADGGVCVPDGLPDADVTESPNDLPAEVVLPEDGSISLGGRVDMPVDLDGDSFADPDYDSFVFYAEAGTWLRIRATSDDAALPAFMLDSASAFDNGQPLYTRYAVEPNGEVTSREVYLPRSDTYVLWVTDYAHLWPYIFGWPTVPVGGDSFTYRVVIENLGVPVPTKVSSLPWSEDGDLDDGALRFYSIDPSDEVAVLARSVGAPLEDTASDVYPILTAFTDDGSLASEAHPWGGALDVDLLLPGSRGHLLVQDHLLVVGPHRDFAVDVTPIVPVACELGDCTGSVSDDHVMYSWELDAGDLLAVGVSHESDGGMELSLVDVDLTPILPRQRVQRFAPGNVALFAEGERSVYLWLQKEKGVDLDTFAIDETVVTTPRLDAETPLTNDVVHLPDPVMADSGVAHLIGSAGQVVLFDPMTPYGNGWTEPNETLLTTALDSVGPATDTLDAEFGTFAPLVAVLPTDGTYLHVVQDADADIAGSTYDTRFVATTPVAVAAATVDVPTIASGSLDAGAAVLAHTGTPWQQTTIEVVTDGFRPEVWVLNRGNVTSLYPVTYWLTDDTNQELGLVARGVGTTNIVTVEHVSFGTEDLIFVRDADGGTVGTFDATIQVFAPPSNDVCATAAPLDLSSGSASVQTSSAGATNLLDLEWSNPCTGRPSQGPDLFYAVDANAGDAFDVSITAEHAAVIYLLDACAGTCLAGASGDERSFTWTAETAGQVIVGVDGYVPTALGDFSLEVLRQ